MAPRTTSAADNGKSSVWCSPIPKKSTPTCSARTPCSTRFRMVWAWEIGRSSSLWVTSPKVSRPRTSGNRPARAEESVTTSEAGVVTWRLLVWRGGGEGAGRASLGGFVPDGVLELGPTKRDAEHRAAGSEETAGSQAVKPDGVVADALDDV